MDRIRKVSYKGKEIVIFDFSNLGSIRELDIILETVDNLYPTISSYPAKTALTLTNVEGTFFNKEILMRFKDAQSNINKVLKKGAVIGIHGLQKIAFDAVSAIASDHNIKQFTTEEAAKEWLVE